MKNDNFTCSITANVSTQAAINAICRVQDWWAKDFTGSAGKLNDEFTVKFGDTFVNFKITEFIPGAKIVWLVTGCYLPWLKDKNEWTNTQVIFEISSEKNLTAINFTHLGLVPEIACYDMCVKGWTEYVPGSLFNLLTNGAGQPS